MKHSPKSELLSSASGWVSALLNFFPGLGVGYIYQRRWKAYWITIFTSSLWLFIVFFNELGLDPSDPVPTNNDLTSFSGLFAIAAITAFESWFSVTQARKISN